MSASLPRSRDQPLELPPQDKPALRQNSARGRRVARFVGGVMAQRLAYDRGGILLGDRDIDRFGRDAVYPDSGRMRAPFSLPPRR